MCKPTGYKVKIPLEEYIQVRTILEGAEREAAKQGGKDTFGYPAEEIWELSKRLEEIQPIGALWNEAQKWVSARGRYAFLDIQEHTAEGSMFNEI